MNTIRNLCALCLVLVALPAAAAVFNTVQPGMSRLGFTASEMGVPVTGGFGRFEARLAFDPSSPSTASVVVDVDLASIDAGSREADDEALGPQWFDAKAYPRARFVSTAVHPLGGNRYEAVGKLTIKGRTETLTIPFTFVGEGATARFDGGFTLRRADFAIGEGEWADFGTVANEVRINFQIRAATQPAVGK